MINKVINIDVDYDKMGVKPSPRQTTLTTYILDDRNIKISTHTKRPAVIVCPGGGYAFTSEREAEPIALCYCAAGIHSFVIDYSIEPSSWPAAASEISKAIIYVREHAEEYCIDPDMIYVAGFSAGGHAAASVGVHYNHPDVINFSGAENENNKPNGVILGYPVITGEPGRTHQGTISRFIGENPDNEPLAWLENFVTPDTPEMFIFHTFADNGVPVTSSLRMANALEANNVKFELHVYPDGSHGLALANDVTACSDANIVKAVQNWIDMSVRWIKERR